MAKREVPEINAGSMADIAFLLLIFFLVTTTMDRDKAYIRSIPKKIDTIEEQPEVQKRDIMAIRANAQNQLMVRDEMMSNPDDISERVKEFYQKNEKLSADETIAVAGNPADPRSNFPLYSRISMSEIEAQIEQAVKAAEEVENTPGADQAIIDFKYTQVAEWEKKKRALTLYGKNILPEISGQAHVRIEVQERTDYELFAKIQSEIEEALFELRNDASKEIFNEGYATLVAKKADDPTDKVVKNKLELLGLLYPGRIIEVTPKK